MYCTPIEGYRRFGGTNCRHCSVLYVEWSFETSLHIHRMAMCDVLREEFISDAPRISKEYVLIKQDRLYNTIWQHTAVSGFGGLEACPQFHLPPLGALAWWHAWRRLVAKVETSNQDRTISLKAAVRSYISKQTNKQHRAVIINTPCLNLSRLICFQETFVFM